MLEIVIVMSSGVPIAVESSYVWALSTRVSTDSVEGIDGALLYE
jgi:hypothetical protein